MNWIRDITLALRIGAFSASVPLIMRLPVRQLEAWLEPSAPFGFDEAAACRTLRVADVVLSRMRRLSSRPCLIRGVTLFYFLRRVGMDVSLVFGVGSVKSQQAGHCWLSKDGEPFLEKTDPLVYFIPMYAFNAGNRKRDEPIRCTDEKGCP